VNEMAEYKPDESPALTRVKLELKDVREKIVKLNSFIESPAFSTLEPKSIKLLTTQFEIMKAYADILELRIEFWGK
jgi:hypothetical protein